VVIGGTADKFFFIDDLRNCKMALFVAFVSVLDLMIALYAGWILWWYRKITDT
jgi:hypothetical protein